MESYDLTTGTFSGTSKRLFYFSIAAFIAGAAMLVAGSVMLGVGIHKYNQNVDNANGVPPMQTTTPGTGPQNSVSTSTEIPITTSGAGSTGAPDILIMLDTSNDINKHGSTNFGQVIDYITNNIAPMLPLGAPSSLFDRASGQTNVGIVGFSDAAVNIMSYYEVNDLASVQDALTYITMTNAKTNPAKALTVVNKLGSTKADNTNVMMVLASGTQSDLDAAQTIFSQFQSNVQNFTFVALGAAGALDFSAFNKNDNVQTFTSTNYTLSEDDTNSLINTLNPTGVTAVPPTIPPPPPGPTCNKDIAILIDQSVTVGVADDFNRQIDYLAKSLVNSWNISSTSIETFGLLYSQLGTHLLSTKPFNYNTTQQFIDDLNTVKGRDPLGFSDIVGGLNSLQSHLTYRRPNFDLTTILITYNGQFDVVAAVAEAKNIDGNIIIVAVNTDPTNLYYLSGTVIETDKNFNRDIAAQINTALCADPVPPSPLPTDVPTQSPSTSTVTSPSTAPPEDYYPCQSNIVFAMDASNSMGDAEFKNMQQLITKNIVAQNWTHFERVGLMSYADASSCTFEYGTFGSKSDFDNTVQNNITRFANGNSITFGMGTLMSTFNDVPLDIQNSIFFTSTSDPDDVAKASTNSHIVDFKGALIIVAIYPAKKSDLLPLVAGNEAKIIEITPTSGIDYNTYAEQILKQFYCGGPTPTPSSTTAITTSVSPVTSVTGPTRHGVSIYTLQTVAPTNTTTQTTIPSSTSPTSSSPTSPTSPTTTGPTTTGPKTSTVTQPPSPTTTGPTQSTPTIPYVPCQSWIYFGVDDSNVLGNDNFMTQLNFISNAIGNITHPERIAVFSMYNDGISWNTAVSIEQIQRFVTGIEQAGPYLLRNQFTALLNNLHDTQTGIIPIGALIFISDTSDAALAGVDQYFNQIQTVPITFVLLGQNLDQSKLTKYASSFISWNDLSKPQPDNWDNAYASAYACSNITTISPTSPTPPVSTSTAPTTSVSPSQSSSTATSPSTTASPTVTSPTPSQSSSTVSTSLQTTTTGTTPAVPFIPCQSWIHFGVDDSNVLQANDFMTQLNFISSAIGNINHPERVAALSMFNDGVGWNSPFSIDQIQQAVEGMQQAQSYLLRLQFAALLNGLKNTQLNNIKVGAVIFISDTSDAALAGAADIFDQISQIQNVRITFVLLGPNPDQNKLIQFSNNFITWRDLSQAQPNNWGIMYGPALGCDGEPNTLGPTSTTVTQSSSSVTSPSTSTIISTSTTASPSTSPQTSPSSSISITSPTSISSTSAQTTTTGTTPSVPYIPCQSWIGFVIDDSDNLNRNLFPNQLDFVSKAIGNITHSERIAALAMYNDQVSWNNGLTISQIQTTVTNMEQNGLYRLRIQFAAIATALSDIPSGDTQPIGALIFISDTSIAAINGADYYMDKMPNVRITFVLLGQNVDSTQLKNFSSNFIYWSDLNQPQPDNWDNLYGSAYACNGISTPGTVSTVTPSSSTITSSLSTQTSPSSSTSIPSTQSTGPTSTPAPGSYYPCQNWITVLTDNSNVLTIDQFQKQLNFTKTILSQVTHAERIRYGAYNAQRGSILYDWNPNNDQQGLQAAIDSTNRTSFGPTILKAIQALVADENQNRTTPDATLIFVTDTSNAIQIQSAVDLYNTNLKSIGIKLTFILVGQNTNGNALQNFDDAIIYNWQNIGFFSQPDGWDLATALRCTAVSSTSPGSTSVTQTTSSPMTSTSTVTTQSSSVSSSTLTSTQSSVSSSSSTQTSSTSPGSYIPCQAWISFGVDDSNSLGVDDFNRQLNFIASAIGNINHPERIQAIGGYDQPVLWNSPFSIEQIQNIVKGMQQAGRYLLRNQFAALADSLQTTQTNNIPVGALIFISDTSDDALVGAADIFGRIQNVQITFVLLGQNTDQSKLTQFSNNFITWRDLSQPKPDNWDQLYPTAYGCNGPISTVSPISTTPSSPTSSATSSPQTSPSSSTSIPSTQSTGSTSTPAPGTYYPCQNWITVLTDNSNTLTSDQFKKQLNFTKAILSQVSNPERIRYGAYNAQRGSVIYDWNSNNDQQSLQAAIDNTNQTSYGPTILKAIQLLVADENQNRTTPDATLIFVTDTSNAIQIQSAVDLYNANLKSIGVKLTFILAGQNTNGNTLQGFDDAIIYNWQNIGFFSQPDGWDLATALRCTAVSSTSPGSTSVTQTSTVTSTSTVTTQSSSISSSTLTSTQSSVSSSSSTSTTSPGSYIPCQAWISFGVDDSNSLGTDDFNRQLNFIATAIGNINHPERIQAIGAFDQPVYWNSPYSINEIQQAVLNLPQEGAYRLREQFGALLNGLQTTQFNSIPIGALIFISDTTDAALAGADPIFNQINQFQNLQITFVLLGQNSDHNKLTQFSTNFITWRDLSQPQPDNWDQLYPPAYGCNGTTSTVSPMSTATTSPTSTMTMSSSVSSTTQTVPSTSSSTMSPSPTTSGATPSTGDYVPCQVLVTTLVDISSTLNIDYFQKQLTFTKTFLSEINHPERIRYGGYLQTNGNMTYLWNDTNTQEGLQQAIDNTHQQSQTSSLSGAMRVLISNPDTNRTVPDSTIIFVTDTTNSVQNQQAVNLYNSSLRGRVKITFILAGNKTDAAALQGFDDAIFFYWQNMNTSQPDNWDTSQALRCTPLSSTTVGSTSTTSPTSTNTSPTTTVTMSSTVSPTTGATPSTGDYIPCQVLVTTLVDISSTLNIDYFQKQLTFTKTFLSEINHPERIRYGGYLQTNGNMTYLWNDTNTQEGLQQAIDNTHQQSQTSSLSGAMRVLISNPDTNRTVPDSTIIFVTDTTNSVQNQQALNLYNSSLRGRVKITFILAGNKTDATALQGFDDAIFFYWQNMNTSQPDNWDTSQALRCTPLSSTSTGSTVTTSMTQPPSTSVSTQGSSSTVMPSTTPTTLSSMQSTTSQSSTTPSSYIPCQSWISFGIDDSNTLDSTSFTNQLNFISNTIGGLNHFERIQAVGAYNEPALWNNHLTLQQIQNAITSVTPSGPYLLRLQFNEVLNNLQYIQPTSYPTGVIIFISDTSDAALANADQFFNQISGVQFTFVLLGPNPDQNKLTKYSSNFVTWRDMTQAQPDNWDANVAYGCTPSTASTVTPITVSSPSTVSPTRGGVTVHTDQTVSPGSSPSTSVTQTVPSSSSPISTQSTGPTSTPAPGTYYPCQNWVTVLADDSNVLTADQFQKELNFTKTILGQISNPERIRYGAYDAARGNLLYLWNSKNDQAGLQAAIDSTNRTSFGPSILKAIQLLIADRNQNQTTPDATIIFVTDTSNPTAISQAVTQYNADLKPYGIKLTFILAGQNTNGNTLQGFDDAVIYNWQNIGFFSQPDGWDLATALRCTAVSSTSSGSTITTSMTQQPSTSVSTQGSSSTVMPSTSPTTMTSMQSTTSQSSTTPSSYIPCQSWISFGIDDSNTLDSTSFTNQLNFISNTIGGLNHFERIQAVGAYNEPALWNNHLTLQQIQNAITSVTPSGPYLLRLQFNEVLNNLQYIQPTSYPTGVIIFISDTSDAALANADQFFNQISGVQITFVLLGPNPDQSKLTKYSSNFVTWRDMTQAQPDNWDANVAYGCTPSTASTVTPITVSSPSTVSPTRGGVTVHTDQTVSPGSSPSTSTTQTVPSSSSPTSTQSTGSTSTPAPGTYYPCQNWVTVLADDSNVLTVDQFQKQLNFTKSILGQVTHAERIRYGAYDAQSGSIIYDWNPNNDQAGLQAAIDSTNRTSFGPTILKAIQLLVAVRNQNQTTPDATLVFVTDTSNAIQIQSAVDLYNTDLKPIGVKLTFILAGQNTNGNALQGFDDAIIYNWQNIGFFSQPDGWDFATAFRCTGSPVTVSSSASTSASTLFTSTPASTSPSSVASSPTGTATVITTPEPYFPCQSWISFSYDDSNTLQNNDFKTQMSFISSAIGSLNYADRLRVEGAYTSVASWISHQSVSQIQSEINNTQQTSITYSLLIQFASLVTNLQNTNGTNWPVGAIIFISDTSDNALRNAIRFMPQLSGVQLTFVLLGNNVDATKLTNFSSNFIYWSDLSQPQPANWDNSYFAAYGCNGIVTQTPPSTVSTVSAPTTSSSALPSTSIPTSTITSTETSVTTAQTTTVTIPSTSTITTPSTASSSSTLIPYIPCQSWISFSYDDSNNLNAQDFQTEMTFISTAIAPINYPDRLRVNGAFTEVASWNSHQNITQMQNELSALEQTQNSYSLLQEFANLLTDYETNVGNTTTWPIGALLFISDTSDNALAHADIYFNQLPPNMRITFVLLNGADQNKLTQFSNNFIFWTDLSQPQPDNWDGQSYIAYGCQ